MPEVRDQPQRRRSPALRALAWMAAGGALVVASLALAARIALPWLDDEPRWAASWLSEQLHQSVEVDRLELAMEGLTPVLRLANVRVRARRADATHAVALERVKVELSPLDSLRRGVLHPRRIRIVGAELHLVRSRGQLLLRGFGDRSERPAEVVMAAALSALPQRSELSLEEARVVVDAPEPRTRSARAWVLEPVGLRLAATAHEVTLSGTVGARPRDALRFQLRWPAARDDETPMDLTLTGRSFRLERLPLPAPSNPGERLHGIVDLDLEGELLAGRLQQARGSIRAEGLFVSAPGAQASSAAPTSALTALFDFSRDETGWRLDLPRVAADRGALDAPGTRARIARAGGEDAPYTVAIESIAMRDALGLARSLLPASARHLSRFEPEGRIEDLELVLAAGAGTLRTVSLRAAVKGVVPVAGEMPVRILPLQARIDMNAAGGIVHLDDLAIAVPGSAASGAATLHASGPLEFSFDERGVSLGSTALVATDGTVNATLSGTARWSHRTRSLASDLVLRCERMSAATFAAYLGSSIGKAQLEQWLVRAIRDGELMQVEASLFGTLAGLGDLVDNLRASGRFTGLTLDYAPDWPALTGLEGQIEVVAGRLGFRIGSGAVNGNAIRSAAGHIESVVGEAPVVVVDGNVRGRIEKGAEYLLASPLRPRFEALLRELGARGPASLDLGLEIPIPATATRVKGTLTLDDNTIAMPALRADMAAVEGRITFDSGGLTGGTLTASYLDRPITASLTRAGERGHVTALEIRGRTTPRGLLRHLHAIGALDSDRSEELPLLARLSGETAWTVALSIPGPRNPDRGLGLAVRSELDGMALDLPAPLGKAAAGSRALDVSTRLDGSARRVFRVAFGRRARAAVEVERGETGFRLRRAGVRLGGEPAALPERRGIVVAGHLDTVSVDEWLALVAQAAGAATGAAAALGDLESVQVRAGRLEALGLGFDDVSLDVGRSDARGFRIVLEGPTVAGEIRVPQPLTGATVVADFERLYASARARPAVEAARSRPASQLNARKLPAVDARVSRLGYGDVELGRASLAIRPAANGLDIELLEVINDAFTVRGSGRWAPEPDRDRTDLTLTLRGDDLGHALRAFGYSDSGVEDAPLEVSLDGHWPGSPLAFSLNAMTGTLRLETGKGRITGIEPGATGRVFGLLSVTLLPRRLFQLDFSDLFGAGIGFKRISGTFRVEDGNAYTDTLVLDADTAEVGLAGRVGLASRDYDQVMTVAPKLSSSLPLAPLWLAEKMLDRKLLDPAFARRYSVTGPWDDPRVERIPSAVDAAEPSADR